MKFLAQRILHLVPMLLVVSFLAFTLVRLTPGGPFDRERSFASPEAERLLREKYLLDAPLWQQYLHYLKNVIRGDLGDSLKHRNHTVNEIIAQGLPISIALGLLAFAFSLCWGIAAGCLTATAKQSSTGMLADSFTLFAICIPALVIGPLLVMVFAIKLRWLPVALLTSPAHFVLPVLTLGIYYAGRVARLTQQGLQATLRSEFILTARSKGLPERTILLRHVLPLGLLPVVSYSGPLLADLMTGSFVAENLFQIPGIGVFLIQSSLSRDYPMIVGLVLVYALILSLMNLAVDLSYRWIDPRIRH
jgi:oligopeptide transport system permease protein